MFARRLDPIQTVAAAYRSGARSPVGVTRAALARIDAVDDRLRAFVSVWHEDALVSARLAEKELAAGVDRGPLHGVPVALKDLIDVAGRTATYGSLTTPDPRPDRDAAIVHALRRAGAVIVGKTNLLEYAYGIVHPAFGQTNNPWDPERTAGGSSGGSAAAVAAGMCFAAIGTDTGGSIRIPAAYCGVAGFKPTFGRLPLDGVFPLSWTLDHVGPITWDLDDMATVWAALDPGPPAAAPAAERATLAGAPVPPDGRALRVGVLERYLEGSEMEAGVAACMHAALARLVERDVRVDHVDDPLLAACDRHLIALVLPEASLIHRAMLARSPDGYAAGTRQQLEHGLSIAATDYLDALAYRERLRSAIDALLDGRDALVLPTAPWVAPTEDPAIGTDGGDAEGRRTAPFNLTGHPVVTFPVGLADGLPVGLQVVGRHGDDAALIALARALADRLGVPMGVTPEPEG